MTTIPAATRVRLSIVKNPPGAPRAAPLPPPRPSVAGFGPGVSNLGPDPGDPPKKLAVLISGNDSFALSITDPVEAVQDLAAIEWTEIPRAREAPWLVDSRRRLRKLNVRGMIYAQGRAVDFDVERLYYMTTLKTPVTFAYGAMEAGVYRISTLEVESQIRERGTNNVIAANVSFTLVQASDPPVPKPVPSAPAPQPASPAPAPASQPKATYVVRRGDTLWALAQKYYGNGSAYGRIAEANGIKDPKRISVGQTLVIP